MGSFDILVDGDTTVQVKCFACVLDKYKVGDRVPSTYGKDFTIVFPGYSGARFALIKDGKLVKLTDNEDEIYPPYVSKWGVKMAELSDFDDPYTRLVERAKARAEERER